MPDTLLHDQADTCLAQWQAHLRAHPQSAVTVDASALVEFDSSALAVLLGFRRVVLAQGGTLHVAHMTARLRELASLYGVLDLLPPA